MKKATFISLIAAFLSLALFSFTLPTEEYNADLSASKLKWTGYHLAKSYSHWGYVTLKSGKINWDGNGITSGEFIIDMTTISNEDLESEIDQAKLEGHLKADDFFAVSEYPEAKLVIKNTSKKSLNVYATTADLTIRGITKEITFDTQVKELNNSSLEATAEFKVKRTDFNVMYGWSLENATLDGEFKMEVNIIAKK
jgi:polyisoprenoid-binding protein YceI